MKNIVVLGSTGSIGRNTLEVIGQLGPDYRVQALSARSSLDLLAQQAQTFRPHFLAVGDEAAAKALRQRLGENSARILWGDEALVDLARNAQADMVVNALVGAVGLKATLAALEAGKTVALANKESIVMAGKLVMETAARGGGHLLPIDSEHSAVFQCLLGEKIAHIRHLILTASGGPFLRRQDGTFNDITPLEALKHPNWQMGPKITIDSATMMNKGLEVIEAHYLFGIPADQIQVIIHPQSVIHSLVEFVDGSLKAQLSAPDMRLPIQYALTYPDRLPAEFFVTDLISIGTLEFEAPDLERFPCLRLAYTALELGEGYPAVLSAANEVAVQAFLDGQLPFHRIAGLIDGALQAFPAISPRQNLTLDEILDLDVWARRYARGLIQKGELLQA